MTKLNTPEQNDLESNSPESIEQQEMLCYFKELFDYAQNLIKEFKFYDSRNNVVGVFDQKRDT